MFQLFFWRESERDHSPKGGNPTLARPKPPNVANLLMPKRKKKKKKVYPLALFNLPFWIGLRYLLISLTREQFAW